ncbi:MAG: response regulator [Bdellovibrio sp.]|nr:response regulator [Bdellovibrio sp.]
MSQNEVLESRFRSFVSDKALMVVDTNPRALQFISSLLTSMGVAEKSIYLCDSYDSAKVDIPKLKPSIILTDYDLDKKCGLNLIKMYRSSSNEPAQSIFILVTANTSQVAVARAAEEEVEGYVLKPFTGSILRETIVKAASTRFEPNEYERLIEEAKQLIAQGDLKTAEQVLETAKTKNPQPALAHFYLGQIELARKDYRAAQNRFQLGLKANRIHCKCLIGLHEALLGQKEYSEAYATLKRFSRYFPLEPPILATMLKLAIQTKTYEDVERLFRIFETVEEKSEELIRYVCAALVVCGKFYLQKTFRSRALELFQHAVKTAQGNPRILKEVILVLAENQLKKEAELFLQFFPANFRESADYFVAKIAVTDLNSDAKTVIEVGKEVLAKDVHEPPIYSILIKRMNETLDIAGAQDLSTEALKRWPDQTERFQVTAPERKETK